MGSDEPAKEPLTEFDSENISPNKPTTLLDDTPLKRSKLDGNSDEGLKLLAVDETLRFDLNAELVSSTSSAAVCDSMTVQNLASIAISSAEKVCIGDRG